MFSQPDDAPAGRSADGHKRLFIVDDSAEVRERLIELLADLDSLEVVGAWDGADAVGTILKLQPDAVIVDLHLQLGSGFDVLRAIKSRPNAPMVIVLTNFSYPQYRKKCLEAGADYFFDKTDDLVSVLGVMKDLVKH